VPTPSKLKIDKPEAPRHIEMESVTMEMMTPCEFTDYFPDFNDDYPGMTGGTNELTRHRAAAVRNTEKIS
jgi:hypothetical protein